MGNPAARASIDKAAHDGPIQSGSPNVNIGGFPAARKDDPIGCSTHGSGTIVGGSGTVFVNGKPLARLGDQTKCNASSSPAAAPAAKTAPPQYWGGTLAKDAGKDGMIHKDNLDARVLSYYSNQEDKTGDGVYDSGSAGFALMDMTLGNLKSKDTFKGEVRSKTLAVNFSDTSYDGMSDMEGMNTTATATGTQFGVTGSASAGGYNSTIAGDGYVGIAEAKAISEVYKGNQGRWGFNAEVGAEAAAVKGEVSSATDYWGVLNTEVKIAASAGSAGAAGGITAYVDETDYSGTFKVSGEIALLLGLKLDAGVKVTFKPLIDWIWDDGKVDEKPASGDGKITTGCITVLVGN